MGSLKTSGIKDGDIKFTPVSQAATLAWIPPNDNNDGAINKYVVNAYKMVSQKHLSMLEISIDISDDQISPTMCHNIIGDHLEVKWRNDKIIVISMNFPEKKTLLHGTLSKIILVNLQIILN